MIIDHNQYIVNNYIFQSNYCGGFHILNGSIPVPMTASDDIQEVGFFEVSTSCSGAGAPWLGSWSNYPFFHSGNVAVSSIEMGLFVLRVSLCHMIAFFLEVLFYSQLLTHLLIFPVEPYTISIV